jgi:hypothetical protein
MIVPSKSFCETSINSRRQLSTASDQLLRRAAIAVDLGVLPRTCAAVLCDFMLPRHCVVSASRDVVCLFPVPLASSEMLQQSSTHPPAHHPRTGSSSTTQSKNTPGNHYGVMSSPSPSEPDDTEAEGSRTGHGAGRRRRNSSSASGRAASSGAGDSTTTSSNSDTDDDDEDNNRGGHTGDHFSLGGNSPGGGLAKRNGSSRNDSTSSTPSMGVHCSSWPSTASPFRDFVNRGRRRSRIVRSRLTKAALTATTNTATNMAMSLVRSSFNPLATAVSNAIHSWMSKPTAFMTQTAISSSSAVVVAPVSLARDTIGDLGGVATSGNRAAVARGAGFKLMELPSMKVLFETDEAHAAQVLCVALGPARTVATGSADGSVAVWTMNAAETGVAGPPLLLSGHTDWVRFLRFASDGKGRILLVSAGDDGRVIQWGALEAEMLTMNAISTRSPIRCLGVSPSHTCFAVGCDDSGVSVLAMMPSTSSSGGNNIAAAGTNRWDAISAAFTSAQQAIRGGVDHHHNPQSSPPLSPVLRRFAGHEGVVSALSISGGELLCAGTEGEVVYLHCLRTGATLATCHAHQTRRFCVGLMTTICSVEFLLDSQRALVVLSVASDGVMVVWTLERCVAEGTAASMISENSMATPSNSNTNGASATTTTGAGEASTISSLLTSAYQLQASYQHHATPSCAGMKLRTVSEKKHMLALTNISSSTMTSGLC